ncbi:hypothetical protein NDU88_000103, partial [Pleurodeles waltl]
EMECTENLDIRVSTKTKDGRQTRTSVKREMEVPAEGGARSEERKEEATEKRGDGPDPTAWGSEALRGSISH